MNELDAVVWSEGPIGNIFSAISYNYMKYGPCKGKLFEEDVMSKDG